MAGSPKKRQAFQALEDVGIESVCARIAEGGTLRSVAAALGIGSTSLFFFLKRPENIESYAAARRVQAAILAEEVLEISDNATPATAQVAKLQVDSRRWMASLLDRDSFGERGPKITVNIQQLHLDALRQLSRSKVQVIEGGI